MDRIGSGIRIKLAEWKLASDKVCREPKLNKFEIEEITFIKKEARATVHSCMNNSTHGVHAETELRFLNTCKNLVNYMRVKDPSKILTIRYFLFLSSCSLLAI